MLSPVFFPKAAARAGSRLQYCSLERLSSVQSQPVVLYADGRASVILELTPGGVCVLVRPDLTSAVVLIAHLSAAGVVRCWSLQPLQRRDMRTARDAAGNDWLKQGLRLGGGTIRPLI